MNESTLEKSINVIQHPKQLKSKKHTIVSTDIEKVPAENSVDYL